MRRLMNRLPVISFVLVSLLSGVSTIGMSQSTVAPALPGVSGVLASPREEPPMALTPRAMMLRSPTMNNRITEGVIGGVVGAVIGGALSGALSAGACEHTKCDNVGRDAMSGVLIGAALGIIVELAIRRGWFRH
jgi:hypothetical protein